MQKDDLTNAHIKNIVEFMTSQKNMGELPTGHVFKLVNKIIIDSMVNSQGQTDGSNRYSELFNLESSVNQLLNSIKFEKTQMSNAFLDSLHYCYTHLNEVPNFFPKAIKHHINKGGAESELRLSQFLMTIGSHYQYIGNFTQTQIAKIVEYQQLNTKFNFDQILKDVNYQRMDDNLYCMIRGIKYLSKVQRRE